MSIRIRFIRLTAVILAMATLSAVDDTFGQQIVLETTKVHFGNIFDDQKMFKKIGIKNTGDKTLNIKNVNTTCGCTVGKLAKRILEPGEETVANISFDPKGKRGETEKKVSFVSNDPVNAVVEVTIAADVMRGWDFEPGRLKFKKLSFRDSFDKVVQSFLIKNNRAEPLGILSLDSHNPHVTVQNPESVIVDPGRKHEFFVEIEPDFKPAKNVYAKIVVVAKQGDRDVEKSLPITIIRAR